MRPVRMCAVCRERKDKSQLLRIAKAPNGEVCIDVSGKMPGRGAYICKNGDCIKDAQKRRVFERALSCKIEAELYAQIARIGDV